MNKLNTKIITVTKDFKDFPFHLLAQRIDEFRAKAIDNGEPTLLAIKDGYEDFALEWGLEPKSSWLLPQTLAYVAKLPLVRDDLGSIDGEKLAKSMLDDQWKAGVYRYLTPVLRGVIIKDQYKKPNSAYCALVPLILYAFKLYEDIPYSSWSGIHAIVDNKLRAAMLCGNLYPQLSNDEKLEYRQQGLLIKSGAKQGTTKSINTYGINKVGEAELDALPELARMMLAQTWCAAPANRHKYMVLDPNAWDTMPAPITSTELFTPLVKPEEGYLNPWD